MKKKSPKYAREYRLAKLGCSVDRYDELLARQRGLCGICNKPPSEKRRLALDHSHSGNFVRGLLCTRRNVGIGHFDDDPLVLQNAIDYLFETTQRAQRRMERT